MAFWRPMTMDTWNPFNRKFWTQRNWFGKSDNEQRIKHKKNFLAKLMQQLSSTHVTDKMPLLLCPLSTQPLKRPLILPDGVILNESSFLERLLKGGIKSLFSSRFWQGDDAVAFTELDQLILRRRSHCQRIYLPLRREIINDAQKCLNKQTLTNTTLKRLTCPFDSKHLMENPVILPTGEVYDKNNIIKQIQQYTQDEAIKNLLRPLYALFPETTVMQYQKKLEAQFALGIDDPNKLSLQQLRVRCIAQCQPFKELKAIIEQYKNPKQKTGAIGWIKQGMVYLLPSERDRSITEEEEEKESAPPAGAVQFR